MSIIHFLLFPVSYQSKASNVRSVCKALKITGIHTVSLHKGASLDHQISRVKSCEPELVVTCLLVILNRFLLLREKKKVGKKKYYRAFTTWWNIGFTVSWKNSFKTTTCCYLAVLASVTRGSILVYSVMDLQSHSEIDAQSLPLATTALSSNGMYIATAVEQGTLIRVHLVFEATKPFCFRRRTYPSTIYSLSFGPSTHLPDILIATSSSGSIHAFFLSLAIHQRSKRSSSWLGSVRPENVSHALVQLTLPPFQLGDKLDLTNR